MVGFLGPEDSWPSHPKSDEWTRTLAFAQARGWFFKRTSDHTWAHIVCRIDDEDGEKGRCDFQIFSSARATDSQAIYHRNKIRKCGHRARPPGPEAAEKLASVAESFLDSAEGLLTGCSQLEEALAELDLASGTLKEARAIERALEREAAARESAERAAILASVERADVGSPPDVRQVLDEAKSRIDDAGRIVSGVSGARPRALKVRLKTLRDRHRALQTRAQE